jgi:hypothetical protein
VVGGAGSGSWTEWKVTRALRAEGVELGVWGEVEGWAGEVGAAGEGVGVVEGQGAGREEGGGSWIGVRRTGRSFVCRALPMMACGGVRSAGM